MATMRQVIRLVGSTFDAGCDAALVTCSSIGAAVDIAAQLYDQPVLRVDRAMAEKAVATGRRIGVVATLSTTLNPTADLVRSEEHTSELQSLMRTSYAVFCLKKKKKTILKYISHIT